MLLASACAGTEVDGTPSSERHAFHGEKLADVMRQLDKLDRELLPKEIDIAAERRERHLHISKLAAAVAASASDIPDVLAGVALTPEQREDFVGLADALEARAIELAAAADAGVDADIQRSATALHASCTACHDRYRVLPRVK